jgi:hypothetical protein
MHSFNPEPTATASVTVVRLLAKRTGQAIDLFSPSGKSKRQGQGRPRLKPQRGPVVGGNRHVGEKMLNNFLRVRQ